MAKDATMGAVRATVKLTNAVDDELVRRGVLNPKLLRQTQEEGLVDTGAVSLVIPESVAQELGLRILGQ
ncbi:MAG: hypothetical protein AAFV72_12675 [Cyanobacteria bacterium J06635_1]